MDAQLKDNSNLTQIDENPSVEILTLEEASEEYLQYLESVRCLSANTVTSYRNDLHHLLLCVDGKKPVSEVSENDLISSIGSLTRHKYKRTSINRYMAAVRGLFSYCKHFGRIKVDVSQELETVHVSQELPRYMTQGEVDELCAEPMEKNLLWQARDRALFEVLYSTGCRVSEIAGLRFSDFKNGYMSAVVNGKGDKDREVYLEKDARDALLAYLEERKGRFPASELDGGTPVEQIFVNQHGTALTAHGIWYILKMYTGPEGTRRHLSPHAFRHTFATSMLNNGADIRMVQKMLGHSSISTTQRYTHVTKERIIDVYRQACPRSGKKD